MNRERVQRAVSVVVAVSITGGLLYLISRHVDLGAAIGQWRDARPLPALGVFALLFLEGFVLDGLKVYLVLRWKGIRVPYRAVVLMKMASAVFHAGLPMKIGSATEAVYLSRVYGCRLEHAISAVSLNLLVNFMALTTVATASTALVSVGSEGLLGFPIWFWSAVGLCGLAGMLVPFVPAGLRLLEAAVGLLPPRAAEIGHGLLEGFRGLTTAQKLTLMGIALGMQACLCALFQLGFASFGLAPPFGYVAIVSPIIFFLGAIPVTVSGFGTREWLLVFFFTRHRALMTPEQAVGTGLLFGIAYAIFMVLLSTPTLPGYLHRIARGGAPRG